MFASNRYAGTIVIALVITFLSFASPSHAEKVTFEKEYTYQASEIGLQFSTINHKKIN